MKKFMKRLISSVVASAIAVTLIVPSVGMKASAAETVNKSSLTYVALGDSITHGASVSSSENFVTLLGKKINATKVYNFGMDGWTSNDIYTQVRTATDVRAALRTADVVTLDVGSNDIIWNFTDITCDYLGCVRNVQALSAKIISMQNEYTRATGFRKIMLGTQYAFKAYTIRQAFYSGKYIDSASAKCRDNITGTIKEIRALNPKCKIYVGNLYNPYPDKEIKVAGYTILNINEIAELWETQFNKDISSAVKSTGCTLVDLHPIFRDKSLIFSGSDDCWDPHPNQQGHQAVANAFAKVIK